MLRSLVVATSCAFAATASHAQVVIYVDCERAGAPASDGASWATAFPHIADAFAEATTLSQGGAADIEIWVADGEYAADGGSRTVGGTVTLGTGSRFDRLVIQVPGVSLLGGFAGDETLASQRDPAVNQTTITGDLLFNDDGSEASRGENAFELVIPVLLSNPTDTFVLDGFELRAIQVFPAAARALWLRGGTHTFRNVLFADNFGDAIRITDPDVTLVCEDVAIRNTESPGSSGGALVAFASDASLTLDRCTFEDNVTDGIGGAIYINTGVEAANLTVRDSVFRRNRAPGQIQATRGGAVYLGGSGTTGVAVFERCEFVENEARFGGVVGTAPGGGWDVLLQSCLLAENTATVSGGAIEIASTSDQLQLVNCTLVENTALSLSGGAIVSFSPAVEISNSILSQNASAGVGLQLDGTGSFAVGHSVLDQPFSGSVTDEGGNTSLQPLFVDDAAGDYRLLPGSPGVDAGSNVLAIANAFFDLDLNPRFTDEPLTADTGVPGMVGAAVIDMGCYERPGDGVFPGDAFWVAQSPGFFSDPANWLPATPSSINRAIYSTSGPFETQLDSSAEISGVVVRDGSVGTLSSGTAASLSITQPTTEPGLLVTSGPGGFASLQIDGVAVDTFDVSVGDLASSNAELRVSSLNGALLASDQITIGEFGTGLLSVDSGASVLTGSIEIGSRSGAFGTLQIGDAGTSVESVFLCEARRGTIDIASGAALTAGFGTFGGVFLFEQGRIQGDGTVNGTVVNFGSIDPGGESSDTLTINGDYFQVGQVPQLGADTGLLTSQLGLDGLGDLTASTLAVTGEVQLAGALLIETEGLAGAAIGSEASVNLVDAQGTLSGSFDVAYVRPALPGNQFVTLSYDQPQQLQQDPAGSPLSAAMTGGVTLSVSNLVSDVGYGQPTSFSAGGTATDADLGDLNGDGLPDLALVVPNETDPDGAAGQLVILVNSGSSGGGWNGFLAPTAQLILPAGIDPSGVSIGNLDGSGGLDIAVSNAGSDNVTLYSNDGLSTPLITLAGTVNTGVGSRPTDIEIADFDNAPNGLGDFAVTLNGADALGVYQSASALTYVPVLVPLPPLPRKLKPLDFDVIIPEINEGPKLGASPGFKDLIVSHGDTGAPSVSLVENLGTGSYGVANIATSSVASSLQAGDLNGDGLPEIVTANEGSGSVTVLVSTGILSYAPPVDLPVGSMPSSVAVVDADDDGDQDLAVVATSSVTPDRIVQVLRNDTVALGQLVLSASDELSPSSTPLLVLAGDLDGDLRDDIVTVNEPPAPPAPDEYQVVQLAADPTDDVSVLLSLVLQSVPCVADTTTTNTNPGDTGYGVPDSGVDGADLAYYVEQWLSVDLVVADTTTTNTNPGEAGYGVPDGSIDGADLAFYVEAWLSGCP